MTWPRVTQLKPPVKRVPEMKDFPVTGADSGAADERWCSGVAGIWTVYRTNSVLSVSSAVLYLLPPPLEIRLGVGEVVVLAAEKERPGAGLLGPMLLRWVTPPPLLPPLEVMVMVTGDAGEDDL